jgi:hypothetical protein
MREVLVPTRFLVHSFPPPLVGCPAPVARLATAGSGISTLGFNVTGYGRSGLPVAFRNAMVLGKPFNDEQLRTILERLLQPSAGVVQLRQSS